MEIRQLRKHVECGIYNFDVVVNRDIAIRALEEYPKLSEYVFTKAKENAKKNTNKPVDEVDILIENIKSKSTSQLYEQDKELEECIKFAFPLMLKAAGNDDLDANEIIEYIYDNGVADDFNAGMYEFILLGFTQREVTKKKVNFSMK